MSDFLVSIGKRYSGKLLSALLLKPYGEPRPKGLYCDFDWGSIAVLTDLAAKNSNWLEKNDTMFAWVGDLATDLSDNFVEAFINHFSRLQRCWTDHSAVPDQQLFEKLNGAFAILQANNRGFAIITDPLSFVQVYVGNNDCDEIVSFGTHSDLVASICDDTFHIDQASAGEFLNSGHTCFPHTMHENVKQLNPATFYSVTFTHDSKLHTKSFSYWSPPKEISGQYDADELAQELREIILSAVRKRCKHKRVAITLSGGLDSRVIMASVPKEIECIGLTFCDHPNRETKLANRVAQAYHRQWHALFRDKEFLANSMIPTVRLTGCECEWIHSHAVGLSDTIKSYDVGAVLTGNLLEASLRIWKASDFIRVRRIGGILPPKFKKVGFDYARKLSPFCADNLSPDIIARICDRRANFSDLMSDRTRTSVASWLNFCVFGNWPVQSTWVAERRVLPLHLPALDKRLIEFGFKCPFHLKLNNHILLEASRRIYGHGGWIPNSEDGVSPNSNHCFRLAQRSVRKLRDCTTSVLEKMGKKPVIQHSWHDYQNYWRTSSKLTELICEYSTNLDEFNCQFFKKTSPQKILKSDHLSSHNGFRLLQLAIWRSTLKEYTVEKNAQGLTCS